MPKSNALKKDAWKLFEPCDEKATSLLDKTVELMGYMAAFMAGNEFAGVWLPNKIVEVGRFIGFKLDTKQEIEDFMRRLAHNETITDLPEPLFETDWDDINPA